MAVRFKQNEDFLRFITMGAAGSSAVLEWLNSKGHRMVELERYAMANKIWETKLKRMRVADLLCLDCGLRVEARAKSKLEVTMSHSTLAGRAWDAGLRDEDLAVFIRWDSEGQATTGTPEAFTVGSLRTAAASHPKATKLSDPKAASEGSEVRLTWRTTVPIDDGVVRAISEDRHKVKVEWASLTKADGTQRKHKYQTYTLAPELPAFAYLAEGDSFCGGSQFLLGVAEKVADQTCRGGGDRVWDYGSELSSHDVITRYVAVKAAGIWRDASVVERLLEIAEHDPASGDEGERIRLEAWASLARIDPARWTDKVNEVARGGDASMALEAVFILTELASEPAITALADFARETGRDAELRAAVVWGLGKTGAQRTDLLVEFIGDDDDLVALHAITAIARLEPDQITRVAADLDSDDRQAASAMAVLSRQGEAGAHALLKAAACDGRFNIWALAGLGEMEPEVVRAAAGGTLPREIAERLEPMWASRRRSWINDNEPTGPLSFLERQTIRHAPPDVTDAS